MNPSESHPMPTSASATGPDPDGPGAPGVPASTVAAAPAPGRLMALALGAGVLAGLASWLVGEASRTAFRPPYASQHVMGQVIMKASLEDQSAADLKNATLAFAVLGGMMGLALGMAGGLARGSARSGMKAAAVGLVLASTTATVASLGLLPLYFRALQLRQEELSRDLFLPLMVHVGSWSAAGLAAGVALGIGLGGGRDRLIKAGLGGLLGAALGGGLYEIIGAMAFSDDKTTIPLSLTWQTRLLARLLVAIFTAAIAAAVVNTTARRPGRADGTP